ncbi:MAG: hypothetical protein HN366_14125 [Deltaproteobacteria bacterium]|nr:hypothetical protein [Deltaproteobacteria bacterium]
MNKIRKSVNAVGIKPQAGIGAGTLGEKGHAHRATILVLREKLLKARNKLAALEQNLEDRQTEFDNLAHANETKSPAVANINLVKHEKRLSAAILETEYATARMKSALAALNERLTSEYTITRQLAGHTPPPPPPPPPNGRIEACDRFYARESGSETRREGEV